MNEEQEQHHKHWKIHIVVLVVVFLLAGFIFLKRDSVLVSVRNLFSGDLSFSKQTYVVDGELSTIRWVTVNDIVGSVKTKGTIDMSTGVFVFEDNELVDGEFSIDMRSLNVTSNSSGLDTERVRNLLTSGPHFSDSSLRASFDIVNVEKTFDLIENAGYEIEGVLTLRGVSNEVVVEAEIDFVSGAEARVVFFIDLAETPFYETLNIEDLLSEIDNGQSNDLEITVDAIAKKPK